MQIFTGINKVEQKTVLAAFVKDVVKGVPWVPQQIVRGRNREGMWVVSQFLPNEKEDGLFDLPRFIAILNIVQKLACIIWARHQLAVERYC